MEEGRERIKKGEKEKKGTEGRNMSDLQGSACSTNVATQAVLREFQVMFNINHRLTRRCVQENFKSEKGKEG